MPLASLICSPIAHEYFGHGADVASAIALPKVGASAAAVFTNGGSNHVEAFSSFLENRPISDLAKPTSFKEIFIKFLPRDPAPESTEMPCEDDMAICNRECERLYGEQESEMQEPCKLAVASEFGGRGLCFPGSATVQERRRGTILVGDVRIGDELIAAGGKHSRVVAFLHTKADTVEVYLKIHYRRTDGSEGCLAVSPAHLVCVRKDGAEWDWVAAQDVRPGSDLEDERGKAALVQAVHRACGVGAFAPLTISGDLVVDGVLCSCYAPPAAWEVPHGACHASMAPLRLLDSTKIAVESFTHFKGAKDPLLTVEALWLLPSMQDASIHPWASGLLRTAMLARAAAKHCKNLIPTAAAKPSSPNQPLSKVW